MPGEAPGPEMDQNPEDYETEVIKPEPPQKKESTDKPGDSSQTGESIKPGAKTQPSKKEESTPEISSTEPIKQETIEDLFNSMKQLPRLRNSSAYQIPYRVTRRSPTEGVFDEETGLYIQAAYNSSLDEGSALRFGRPPGLTVIVATPELTASPNNAEDPSVHIDKMEDFLRRVYKDTPDLEKELQGNRNRVERASGKKSDYDRIKWELLYDEGNEVLSDFLPVSGGGDVDNLTTYATSRRRVLDSGGKVLKGIIERVAKKQNEEAEINRLQTNKVIKAVESEIVPNEESRVYEYAYHATNVSNIPEIAESGLLPSDIESKEPGTIFFSDWDAATQYLPKNNEGVLYRFKVSDFSSIASAWEYDLHNEFRGQAVATDQPIPTESLDFSIDGGKKWMPVVPRTDKQAA